MNIACQGQENQLNRDLGNLCRAEMAANNLFMRLKSIPILILDSTAPDQNFQLRFAFSPGNGDQTVYRSAIRDVRKNKVPILKTLSIGN